MNKGAVLLDKDSFMFVVTVRFWQHRIPILASVFRHTRYGESTRQAEQTFFFSLQPY